MYVRFYLIADPMLTEIDNQIIAGGYYLVSGTSGIT
jgi:hypothetical protein